MMVLSLSKPLSLTSWNKCFPSSSFTLLNEWWTVGRDSKSFFSILLSYFFVWLMQVTTSTMSTISFWKVFENNFAGCNTCKLKQTINGICASVHFLYQPANFRLCHKKNKGVQQSHTLSRISEAIDVWKVVRHPPSRHVVACDDYSFKNTIVLFFYNEIYEP